MMNLTKAPLRMFCDHRNKDGIRDICRGRSVPAIAEILSEMSPDETRFILLTLIDERAGKILVELPESFLRRVLTAKAIPEMAPLLEIMESDDLTDVAQRLDQATRSILLRHLSGEKAEIVAALLTFPEGTVGSIMRTEFFSVPSGITAGEALHLLRKRSIQPSDIHNLYLTNSDGRLEGILPLTHVVMMEPEILLLEKANRQPITIAPEESVEEAVRMTRDYDLIVLPVRRTDGKMLGVVTTDDIMDVEVEETTMAFHKMAPVLKIDLKTASYWSLLIARAPWLVILVFMNIFSGAGIAYFEETIEAMVALVFFLPLLIDSGGNAGSQAATLMVRALATGDVRLKDWARLFAKEVTVALGLGLLMAMAVAAIAAFRAPEIMVPVALTMVSTVLFGSLIGMSLPFILTKFRLDPATASAPLITSIADIGGVLIYFGIATWYLGPVLANIAASNGG
jgi:magnesium transporter